MSDNVNDEFERTVARDRALQHRERAIEALRSERNGAALVEAELATAMATLAVAYR